MRCRAHLAQAAGLPLRCEIELPQPNTPHGEDHRATGGDDITVHWTDAVAVYPLVPGAALSGREVPCRARHAQFPELVCRGMVPEGARHGEHWAPRGETGEIFRWTEMVAMYPTSPPGGLDLVRSMVRGTQVGGEHYQATKIQPWDVIDAWGLDGDHYRATALKYLYRAGRKGSYVEDLQKAVHYLQKAIEREEERGGGEAG